MPLSVRSINLYCLAIDDEAGKTIAYVTPQGWVDWLIREPGQPGEHLESIDKETHLGNVRGMKFNLHVQHPWVDVMRGIDIRPAKRGFGAVVSAQSSSKDGSFLSECRAEIGVSAATGRYEWSLATSLKCVSPPAPFDDSYIEYNNILPANTGGRFLCERRKKFDRFLVEDRDGAIWEMPHQHVLDYWLIGRPGRKKIPLQFRGSEGNWGGFFGEEFNPVVTMESCDGEPCWGICDAYLDFHCCTRHERPLQPGGAWKWRYRIHWLDAAQSRPLMAKARRIPVSAADWKSRGGARLGLGFNDFRKSVQLDGVDEGSAFIPDGRRRFWEKSGGPGGNGVLKMVSTKPGELVWPAAVVDPTQMPLASRLRINGKIRVEGKCRMFFRLKPHIFEWRPEPHVDWLPVICSEPVGDTAGRWVEFGVPEYARTAKQVDTELAIELVLDGPGTGSVSGLDVVLEDLESKT